ncbi:MAG: hypothetical protein HC894_14555 [Microcoleus sp. SM1_3_4]|nr:hypothetical protein [Microcoleus sp. SM1_3_4]
MRQPAKQLNFSSNFSPNPRLTHHQELIVKMNCKICMVLGLFRISLKLTPDREAP